MTTCFGGTGLSLLAQDNIVRANGWAATLTPQITTWRHTIQALGGYWSAAFQLHAPLADLDDWLQDGLGRHVALYDEAQTIIWEGFVDRIQLAAGAVQAVNGPLTNIANRVNLWYSTVDTSTTPPTVGCRIPTGIVNDSDSQARYGVFVKILSCGGAQAAEAVQLRDTYLVENAWPRVDLNSAADAEPALTVDCLGYSALLRAFPYNSTTTGTQAISTKLPLVLAADPSTRFSTDYTQIATNALTTKAFENDNDLAWDVIKGMVVQGDSSENRYTFGIYANRRAVYAAAPTTVLYYQHLREPGRLIRNAQQAEVRPWNVTAGQWLFFPDFLIGRVPEGADLKEDPRAAFLESVTYEAPYGLTWQGSRIRAIDQKMAQLGLAGLGG